jgi:hypothetical protein
MWKKFEIQRVIVCSFVALSIWSQSAFGTTCVLVNNAYPVSLLVLKKENTFLDGFGCKSVCFCGTEEK